MKPCELFVDRRNTALSVQRTRDVMFSKQHAKWLYKNKIIFKRGQKKKKIEKRKKEREEQSRTEKYSLPQGLLHAAQKG